MAFRRSSNRSYRRSSGFTSGGSFRVKKALTSARRRAANLGKKAKNMSMIALALGGVLAFKLSQSKKK